MTEIEIPKSAKIPKGCSRKRAEEIEMWVRRVWDLHWKELASQSNALMDFRNYALRDYEELIPEEMKKIELSVKAHAKHLRAKKRAGDKVFAQHLSTFYNKRIYEQEFIDESAASIKDRTFNKLEQCSTPDCTKLVHGPAYRNCTDCLYKLVDPWKNHRKQAIKVLQLMPMKDETTADWGRRCRDYLTSTPGFNLCRIRAHRMEL